MLVQCEDMSAFVYGNLPHLLILFSFSFRSLSLCLSLRLCLCLCHRLSIVLCLSVCLSLSLSLSFSISLLHTLSFSISLSYTLSLSLSLSYTLSLSSQNPFISCFKFYVSSLVFPDGINVLSPFRIHNISLGFAHPSTPTTAFSLSFTVSRSSTFTQ